MTTALPIDPLLPQARRLLAEHGGLVVIAPPGSGKTTRLAPALLESVEGRILLLQPRRVAARLAARRIAHERGSPLGGEVGYSVRFDRKVGPDTRLEVLTEGLLTRRLLADPFLEGVGAVVLDEFHERSLDLDLCLAMLRELQADARPELKLVVMSATLDPAPVARFLRDAPVLEAPGRTFPVDIRYAPDHGYLDQQVARAVHRHAGQGHTLVFLPGKGEIRRAQEALQDAPWPIFPLHGGLKPEQQEAALAPSDQPKVVLATNIAETSVTLPGVRCVIDTGLSRVPHFDPALGLSRLELGLISQASADQRAGRAGRTGPGIAIRLWEPGRGLRPFQAPEIERVDLSSALLAVLEWGSQPQDFGWFQAPAQSVLGRAQSTLESLGALRGGGGLSDVGHTLAQLPTHPRLGAVIIEGHKRGHLWAACVAAALVSERDPWEQATFPGAREDDLHARVQAMARGLPGHRKAKAELDRVVKQLQALASRTLGPGGGSPKTVPSPAELSACLLAGFSDRVAQRRAPGSPRFLLASGQGAVLDSASLVEEAPVVLAVALDGGRKGERSEHWIRIASPLDPQTLPTRTHRALRWEGERLVCSEQERLGALVLKSRPAKADPGEIAHALAERVRKDPAQVLRHSPELEALLARVDLLREHCPELELPDLDPLGMVDRLCVGRSSLAELRALDWAQELLATLPWEQQQALREHAPERIRVSSGSNLKVTYARGERPVLAARIQQLFGMDTPRICKGGVALRVHLLAPNNRPQQVTDDLAGFWTGSYAEVRKQLRGRYPKHAWPEQPTAQDAQDRPQRKRR